MAFPKMKDLRSLTDREVEEQILGTKRELFGLRMKQATKQPVSPHEFKHAKHRLGQLMTLEHERKSQASSSQANLQTNLQTDLVANLEATQPSESNSEQG
jgi:large subunit ribosomal protein L29